GQQHGYGCRSFTYGARLKRRRASYCVTKRLLPAFVSNGAAQMRSAKPCVPETRARRATRLQGSKKRPKPDVPCGTYRHLLKQSIVAQGQCWLNFYLTVTILFIKCDTRG